jgi:hypothetical protein
VVARVLQVRYSVLEVRKQTLIRLLLGLEQLQGLAETARFSEIPPAAAAAQEAGRQVFDGGRVQLFSAFLSEEMDVDFLAMFLTVRESVQGMFR